MFQTEDVFIGMNNLMAYVRIGMLVVLLIIIVGMLIKW